MLKKIITSIFILFLLLITTKLLFDNFSYKETYEQPNTGDVNPGVLQYKIAVFSDSHKSYDNLQKAVDMSKKFDVKYIIHTGDLSDFGETESYIKSKEILEESSINYVVIAGDRDEVENGTNFNKYFESKECYDTLLKEYKILCLHNSFNYTQLSNDYIDTFINNLSDADILISAQPLYNPNSNIYMGFYDDGVKKQSDLLLEAIKLSNVSYIISADTHFFSSYKDGSSNIIYYTNGALTFDRNIQNPNFTIISVYNTGTVLIEQQYLN